MSDLGHPALTCAGINEIAEALRSGGARARKAKAAHARLRLVLDVLTRGTIDEEIARKRMAAEIVRQVVGKLGLPSDQNPTVAELARLETLQPSEAIAVLESLDVVEPHFPDLVRSVRLRHDRGFAALQVAAAGDQRGGDPTRPELTRERIAELLELVPRIHAREPAIGEHLFRPSLPDENGKSARRLLGTRLAAVVEELAGDVHAFARDLFWLHFIAFRVRGDESIDGALFRAIEHSAPGTWKPLPRRRRTMIAGEIAGTASLLKRVGRREEAAVREAAEEVRAMVMRYRSIGRRAAR